MTFVRRDVVRLRALDFILRIVVARVVGMPFVVEIFGVYLDDCAADMPGFRIPCHMIADLEPFPIMNLRSRFEVAVPGAPRF